MKSMAISLFIFLNCIFKLYSLEELKIGDKNNGNPIITYNQDELKLSLESMINDGTTINNVEIHQYELSFYLVGIGSNSGNYKILAFRLIERDDELITYKTVIVDLHSCEGRDCSSCSFQRDAAGNITGCQCNAPIPPGGFCNHSVRQVPIEL